MGLSTKNHRISVDDVNRLLLLFINRIKNGSEKFIQTSFGLVEIVPGRVYKRQSVNVLFWGVFCHFVLLINSIECFSVPLIVVLSKRVVSASKSSQLYRVIMNL